MKILNEKEFIEDLFLYCKDRRKLPFKNYKFDLKEYTKTFLNYNEKINFEKIVGDKILLLVLKADNSLLEEGIQFNFEVKKTGLKYIR